MAGIKDVAERAGVSVTTVSRVLNKRGYISEQMYQRVYRAIEELNYYPNQLARNLYLQRTFMIGLLLPDISYPFFARMTKQIEMNLKQNGYKMLLCNTVEDISREREYLTMLNQNKVDGIILGSHTLSTSDYLKVALPMVSIDKRIGSHIPNISSNHRMGGELAARKLMENGCKNVVQITGGRIVKTDSQERHKAFRNLLNKSNVKCTTFDLKRKELLREEYAKIVQEIFSANSSVDGIFAEDCIAAKVLQTALSLGIRVPQDLKIVGYNGTEIAELTYPRLTTVCQNYSALSASIVNNLTRLIEHKEVDCIDTVHEVVLHEGGTTE